MDYWKIKNLHAFLTLLGMLAMALSIFIVNSLEGGRYCAILAMVGMGLIGLNSLFSLISVPSMAKKKIEYLNKREIFPLPYKSASIRWDKGKWVIYVLGFVFTILSFVTINADSTILTTTLLGTYILIVGLIIALDSKSSTKYEKILLIVSIPLYIAIVYSDNMRLSTGLAMAWMIVANLHALVEYGKVFRTERRERLSWLIPFVGGYSVLIINHLDTFQTFHEIGMIGLVCSICIVTTMAFLWHIEKKEPKITLMGEYFLGIVILPLILGFALSAIAFQINYSLDFDQSETMNVEIIDKGTYEYQDRTNYYLVYDVYEESRIYVSEAEYLATNVGDSFEFVFYEGFLGLNYYILDENEYIQDRRYR